VADILGNFTVLIIMLIYGLISGASAIILKIGIFKAGGIHINNFFKDVLPTAWRLIKNPTWFTGGMAAIAGFLVYTVALNIYDVSVVKPLVNTNLLFTFVLAYLVFKEKLTLKEWFGIVILISGLLFMAFAPTSELESGMNSPLLFAFFPVVIIMLILMIFVMFVARYGYAELIFPLFAGSFFGMGTFFTKSLLVSLRGLSTADPLQGFMFFYSLFMLLLTYAFAIISQQLAFERGRLSIVSPITNSLSVTVSFIGAYFVFYEELIVPVHGELTILSFFKIIGVICILIALFILRREIDPNNFLDQREPQVA